eukprot:CCRYP_003088-RB/>CCRYP_003088-RB protein AED:0.09 eAED:0.09 QI:95/-1/1/1/-1/1/1/168/1428
MITVNDLDAWDQHTQRVLGAIRCFVDALRSAPYPPELSVTVGRHNQTQRGLDVLNRDRGDPSLIAHLRNAGVFDQVQQLDSSHVVSSDQVSSRCGCHSPWNDSISPLPGGERRQILYQFVFPLLKHLHDSYVILDNAPESVPPPPSPLDPRRKQKPQPARGMLSLNDYTNVACLLEFAVGASLLPQLEHYRLWDSLWKHDDESDDIDKPYTTILAQKRGRSLPKSLSGRISASTLAWGTYAAAEDWSRIRTSWSEKYAKNRNKKLEEHVIVLSQNCDELNRLVDSVARLVLLDRFRPMLLPRHLGDFYMTLIFLERGKWSLGKMLTMCRDLGVDSTSHEKMRHAYQEEEETLRRLQVALRFSPLNLLSVSRTDPLMEKSWNASESQLRAVDQREAALAYRTLLSGEAAVVLNSQSSKKETGQHCHLSPVLGIPPWLRLRLGQCLTKLAEEDLRAVVDVFVASARGVGSSETQHDEDIMTGAAARLARALCAKPFFDGGSTDAASIFQDKLCHQFVDFLVDEGQLVYKNLVNGSDMSEGPSRHYLAMSFTLWATIGQLPEEILKSCFVQRLVSGLIPRNDDNAPIGNLTSLQSASAIFVWLSGTPSSLDPLIMKKLHSIMLNSFHEPSQTSHQCNSEITILGQLLRLAASFRHESLGSKLVTEMKAESSFLHASQKVAEMALGKMVCSLLSEENHVCSMALELVKVVATNHYDRVGYVFGSSSTSHANTSNSFPSRVFELDTCNVQASDASELVQRVEQRARVLVEVVIAPISNMVDNIVHNGEKSGAHERTEYSLPSALFRLVLVIHYLFTSSSEVASNVASKVDALLSEYGSLDIHDEGMDGSRLAATVLLGLLCESCSPTSMLIGTACGRNEKNSDILELLGIIIDCAACRLESLTTEKSDDDAQDLLSTTSIIVSLLVSLLELGANKRSDNEEKMLQAMLPSLQILSSSIVYDQFQSQKESDSEISSLSVHLAELAEMSSHAMALIGARKSGPIVNYVEEQVRLTARLGLTETITEKLLLAERDLQSSQPPLRAAAVVSLRHIARTLLTHKPDLNDGIFGKEEKRVMVTEVEPTRGSTTEFTESEQLGLIARSLARVCLVSLADSESYVYLASIQTLVVICDVCPYEILPMTATLIATGSSDLTILASEEKASFITLTLSPEQRIKLAEALICMIRRRGDGIFLYGRLLLDLMVFGSKQSSHAMQDKFKLSKDTSCNIQGQTHLYFIGHDSDRSEEAKNDDLEERQFRINAGGPVFKIEEDDLLRATSISVVCELIAALRNTSLASYCHILVSLAIDALQLDCSRPVRRAAALLARELYACVEREVCNENNSHPRTTMVVAMVCSREEVLHNVLLSSVSATDINSTVVNGKTRCADGATQARCQEALEIRMHLDSLSIFGTASLIAQSITWESKPAIKAIRKALI